MLFRDIGCCDCICVEWLFLCCVGHCVWLTVCIGGRYCWVLALVLLRFAMLWFCLTIGNKRYICGGKLFVLFLLSDSQQFSGSFALVTLRCWGDVDDAFYSARCYKHIKQIFWFLEKNTRDMTFIITADIGFVGHSVTSQHACWINTCRKPRPVS